MIALMAHEPRVSRSVVTTTTHEQRFVTTNPQPTVRRFRAVGCAIARMATKSATGTTPANVHAGPCASNGIVAPNTTEDGRALNRRVEIIAR